MVEPAGEGPSVSEVDVGVRRVPEVVAVDGVEIELPRPSIKDGFKVIVFGSEKSIGGKEEDVESDGLRVRLPDGGDIGERQLVMILHSNGAIHLLNQGPGEVNFKLDPGAEMQRVGRRDKYPNSDLVVRFGTDIENAGISVGEWWKFRFSSIVDGETDDQGKAGRIVSSLMAKRRQR